jgi:D-glycero-beta-D-manno-heptose-7-phosphate kinase
MVKLTGTFSKLEKINVLVIGDLMLDQYTYGEVNRISPEAPVSILKVTDEKVLPGGAGNVVLNLLSLGANVLAMGRIGDDQSGEVLIKLLTEKKVDVKNIFVQKDFKTPLKNRFIAASQQVLRVDFENIYPLEECIEKSIFEKLPSILTNIQVIAISDYAKGFLSDKLLKFVIDLAKSKKIPVIIDPKGSDFKKYKYADIIKPNLKEAYAAAKLNSFEDLNKAAKIIFNETCASNLIITRSQDGMSLFSEDKRVDFPVVSKEIKDGTGAGDTVLAMLCIAIGNNLDLKEACQLANIAASLSVEHIGCAQISLNDVAKRLLENDLGNKIFDVSHISVLNKVIENKNSSLLLLNSKQGLTTKVFKAMKNLSQNNQNTIVYILDSQPDDEFIELLSSLNEVDFIILKNKNFKNLINEIKTENIYLLKEDELYKLQNQNELFFENF